MNAVRSYPPPGPGGWEIDPTHFPRPPSPISLVLYTTTFLEGLSAGLEAMGSLLERLDMQPSGGFIYTQPRVVGAPAGAPPPPAPVLWLVSRLHPAMRRRARRAAEVFATGAWREEARRFEEIDKPALIARHRALLALPVDRVDDGALVGHLHDAFEAMKAATYIHGRYTAPCQVPVGDYIAHVTAWTGRPPHEVLAIVAGYAPSSAGWTTELGALVAALRASPTPVPLDEDADPAEVLAALTADPIVGESARAWIDLVGWRTVASYDPAEPVALEVPFLLVATLRAAVAGRLTPTPRDTVAVEALRAEVPEVHRADFDRLLEEARSVSALRDERTLYADYHAAGIYRRAVLEAGRRLVARGLLAEPAHLCAATLEEAAGLLARGEGPDAATLALRAAERNRFWTEAPATLGTLHAPPPADLLPVPLARGMRAVIAVIDAMFKEGPEVAASDDVVGLGASSGVVEGVVRRVDGPSDFHRLRPGDVLVTTSTSPVYNVVLPMLSALVTDRGGALSHAAIVSREFGIPGIVGCRDATTRLREGDLVRVDGTSGRVTCLGRGR